jgi:hypothetical protein
MPPPRYNGFGKKVGILGPLGLFLFWRLQVPSQVGVGDLIAVSAIVGGFGITVIMFRIQRELEMQRRGETSWIACSDYLILASIFMSTFLVTLPLLAVPTLRYTAAIARAACAAALILEAGYIPSILAHYRIGIGEHRKEGRTNPEPGERLFIGISALLAIGCFSLVLLSNLP